MVKQAPHNKKTALTTKKVPEVTSTNLFFTHEILTLPPLFVPHTADKNPWNGRKA